jgi:hypothetical protein
MRTLIIIFGGFVLWLNCLGMGRIIAGTSERGLIGQKQA